MNCANCKSVPATARYVYGQGASRHVTELCDPCLVILVNLGMDLRLDERLTVREDTRPAWLRVGRLARADESWRVAS